MIRKKRMRFQMTQKIKAENGFKYLKQNTNEYNKEIVRMRKATSSLWKRMDICETQKEQSKGTVRCHSESHKKNKNKTGDK